MFLSQHGKITSLCQMQKKKKKKLLIHKGFLMLEVPSKASSVNSKGKEYHHQVLAVLVKELFTTAAKQADHCPGAHVIAALLMGYPYYLMTTVSPVPPDLCGVPGSP